METLNFDQVKVAFVFGGMPHYIVKLLNTIQEMGVEVIAIVPAGKGKTLGSGVHQTFDGAKFQIVLLEEYTTYYGKPFFRNLYKTLKGHQADALVLGWPYFLALLFKPRLRWQLKRINCKIYAREIPFTVPLYTDTLATFSEKCVEAQKT